MYPSAILDEDEDERNLRRVSYLRATKDFDSDLELEQEETAPEAKRFESSSHLIMTIT